MKKIYFCLILILGLNIALEPIQAQALKIKVTSSAFQNNNLIPDEQACEFLGEDKSPELSFSKVPTGTQSFAVIMHDPDAPGKNFLHWIIFNIPLGVTSLKEGLSKSGELEDGTRQGINGTGQTGYFGPCPPPKETHRYIFNVFALDTILSLEGGATKKQLTKAMKGHILGRGKLTGLYKNQTSN